MGNVLHKPNADNVFHKRHPDDEGVDEMLNAEITEGPNAPDAILLQTDPNKCYQAGCPDKAVNTYRIKKLYSDQGDGLLPDDEFQNLRSFCKTHSHRGDSALEDCDENYELISGNTGE